jgi:prepilin peptidase CpaA
MMSSAVTITPIAILIVLVAFVVLCWAFDLRERRIPNWLSGSAVVAGLGLNLLFLGVSGLAHSLLGLAVTGGMLLAPFLLGGIGAGDVKMMGAVGSLLGPGLGLQAVVAGFIVGGVLTLAHLAYLGRAGEKLAATAAMIGSSVRRRTVAPLRVDLDAPGAVVMPYSLALGVGSLAVVLLGRGLLAS